MEYKIAVDATARLYDGMVILDESGRIVATTSANGYMELTAENQRLQAERDALLAGRGTNIELCLIGIMQAIMKGWQTGDMGDVSDLVIRATDVLTAWNYAIAKTTPVQASAVEVQP